ncbi:hypothetical protein JCM10212_001269 [Sporobolomyces blumeae]
MSNCLPCEDPIAPCKGCTKDQQCIQTGRSCTQCPRNICVDNSGSSKGAGPSAGVTAGATVGGVLGVAAILAAVYFFWWRPRGLAASRKRYSKHLAHRQSKIAEKRKTQLGPNGGGTANGALGNDAADVAKRTSVHLRMDGTVDGAGAINRRSGIPEAVDETTPMSRTSEDDNPFGDQNRSSIGTFNDGASTHTSEFSFRSSHSTNIIPIAYIPPHSSSLSVDDASRGAYGQNRDPGPPPRSSAIRASIPTSMASRDSLALAGAEIIELNPLPPVLTPDTPAIPHGTMANGAPIRPPRSPGLDLQLPKTSSPLASPPINSPHLSQRASRPPSGFPFAANSGKSSPTSGSQLLPPSSRGMSVLGERNGSASSHLSVMSSVTSRSGNSTMSYILDPPQIITPVNAQGVKRVEFQQGHANVIKILPGQSPSSANRFSPTSPTSPLATNNPFSDSASIPDDGDANESRPGTSSSRWTASSLASDASEAVQFLKGQAITFTNPNTPRTAGTSSTVRGPNTQSTGTAFDVPRSARSSEAYSMMPADEARQSTWSSSGISVSMSRQSTASGVSSASHDSLLEGIPFMAPPLPSGPSTSSINLSLPINVTGPTDGATSQHPSPDLNVTPKKKAVPRSSLAGAENETDDDPLPAPFLPFAGQRPTSSASNHASLSPSKNAHGDSTGQGGQADGKDRVQSEAFSVRSGFGSGLSQIPFQLGFPSGFGDEASDRGSVMTSRSRTGEEADEGEEDQDGVDEQAGRLDGDERAGPADRQAQQDALKSNGLALPPAVPSVLPTPPDSPVRVPAPSPLPPTAKPSEAASSSTLPPTQEGRDDDNASNPFGSHAEVEDEAGADPRASMDTLALSAALSANLDAAG